MRRLPVIALAVLLVACGAAEQQAAAPATPTATAQSAEPSQTPEAATPTPAATPSSSPSPSPSPAPSPSPSPSPSPDPGPSGPVTLAFGGDVHFEAPIRDLVTADPQGALAAIEPVLSAADIAVVNLETAITDRGTAAPKQYIFAGPTEGLEALLAAGVDVASLANNHGMDRGDVGLTDTLEAAEAVGLPLIGAGYDEQEAFGPWTTEIAGRSIAIIGATQVLDSFALTAWVAGPDEPGLASAKEEGIDRLLASVSDAAQTHDTVVVYLHWGREGETCPLPRQPELARQLVDAGADVIVGGHAHRLAGGGMLDDAYVHYGLGNFVFYTSSGPGTSSGVLVLEIAPDDTIAAEWVPAVIQGGVPVPLEGAEAEAAVAEWEQLRSCTDLSAG